MATLAELKDLIDGSMDDGGLRGKVLVASLIKAEDILGEATPGPNRLAFAEVLLANPQGELEGLFNYVIAANDSATISQITGAADSAIQSNVDAAIDALRPSGA